MKRVLQVFGTMNCGGAETMLMNIYRNIDRNKIQFDFLVNCKDASNPPKGFYDDEITSLGGKIMYINSQGTSGLIKYISELTVFLKKNNYDIVHSHMDWLGGAIAFAAHRAGVKKIIVHSHTMKMSKSGVAFKAFLSFQKLFVKRYATDFWGCSEFATKFLFDNNKKSLVIPNAIFLDKFITPDIEIVNEIKNEYKKKNETVFIGHVGTFSSVKNQLFLVEVANNLKANSVDFSMVLVGKNDTEYADKVFQKINEYDLENNVFCPGLRSDIYNFMNAIDMFCFPSAYEGLGMVAIEAQAGGTYCIASDKVPQSIDIGLDLTEFLSTDDPEMWAEKIINAVNKKIPPKEIINKTLSSKGYDIKKSVRLVEELYLK